MNAWTYFKFGKKWYLDNPEYISIGGPEEDLEQIGGWCELLEQTAQGEDTVSFWWHDQYFEEANVAILMEHTNEAACYYLPLFQGKVVNLELWQHKESTIQDVLPKRLYLKFRPLQGLSEANCMISQRDKG